MLTDHEAERLAKHLEQLAAAIRSSPAVFEASWKMDRPVERDDFGFLISEGPTTFTVSAVFA